MRSSRGGGDDEVLDDGDEQLPFAGVVDIDGAGGDASQSGDFGDGSCRIAFLEKDFQSCIQDLLLAPDGGLLFPGLSIRHRRLAKDNE